uniref:Kelch domain-containing protein 7A n=1 Tax=Sus scrofa TaxID=9823 RepID=A0A4X1W0Q5_PIG
MQLTGKVVLSAAALLLVTAAYRLYKSRPAPAPLGGRNTKAGKETEGSGQPAGQGAVSRLPQQGLKRRRGSKGAGVPRGCSWENPGGSGVLATEVPSKDSEAGETGKSETEGAGEEHGRQCPDADLAKTPRSGREARTPVGGKPELSNCPALCSEPQSSPTGLIAVDSGHGVGGKPPPWQESGPPEQPGPGGPESPHQGWVAHTEGKSDMNKSWVFTHVTGVHREEAGALRAASDLDGFGDRALACPDQSALLRCPISSESLGSSSAGSSEKPQVHAVAGTNFFYVPLIPGSAPDVHLDLGNCYEVLTLAKRQKLEALKEAAYKVMSDNYLQVLRSPDIYGCLSGAERELILQRRLRGRKHLVVADICPQEDSSRLCCYDSEQDAWHPLARLPPEAVSRGCAICSLFNYLFVVSGCQGSGHQPSNRVFCYNPLTGIWSEVCPLNQARPHCRLVALDGHLYAIGGECLYTVERYDPRLDRWTFAPPLPNDTFALAHTATACAGEIFVTGGSLRYLLLRFSAQEQRWRAGPTGGGKDRTAEMVAVNGFLYRFDLNRSLGISVYRCSASARLWYECATYRTPYPDTFQCAVVDHLIYCVGRQRILCFLADSVSPRFVPEELQNFPSPQGTLVPTVLTLPGPDVPQTRV